VLTPATGKLAIASAGHFPPVVAVPGQPSSLADIAVGVPIGVADDPVWQTTTVGLTPGTTLCLFTDGLVERRHTPIDDRLTQLIQIVAADPPESVCASVMRGLVGREQAGDDTALLVLRWHPAELASSCAPNGQPLVSAGPQPTSGQP
jgi:serine phosphatase RsbU (regulator of sigma subunit)